MQLHTPQVPRSASAVSRHWVRPRACISNRLPRCGFSKHSPKGFCTVRTAVAVVLWSPRQSRAQHRRARGRSFLWSPRRSFTQPRCMYSCRFPVVSSSGCIQCRRIRGCGFPGVSSAWLRSMMMQLQLQFSCGLLVKTGLNKDVFVVAGFLWSPCQSCIRPRCVYSGGFLGAPSSGCIQCRRIRGRGCMWSPRHSFVQRRCVCSCSCSFPVVSSSGLGSEKFSAFGGVPSGPACSLVNVGILPL